MKSDTRLDAAIFQLTPTRTRCDFVISANGVSEKIASGLLNPFLAHLKTARQQIATGGYTITLQPSAGTDAPWFTKGTLERFVRFVSTPEILERADTIESEILQICEALDIQSNDNFYPNSVNSVEEDQSEAASAIVLYRPGIHPEPGGRWKPSPEESKEHFLRVLESRKMMLHSEQEMTFARAAAAGFDAENVADLMSFAQCFGAKRMLKACIRFDELLRRKKEAGQRLEIDFHESEAMSMRSDFPSLSSLDVLFSPDVAKRDWASCHQDNSAEKRREVPGWSCQMPFYPHYPHFLSHYAHHVLPPYSLHSSFPPYPSQCYTNKQEFRSTVDQRPAHDVDGRNGPLDLSNGRKGRESAEKPLPDEPSSESCSSSESESGDQHLSDEDELEMNQSEEVDGDVNWWIPDSLLPRSDHDHDYMRDKMEPVEGTTPPSDGAKLQKSRCDVEDDPSLVMVHRRRERESDGYDPIKDDSEAMIRSSVAAENGATKRAKEENKRLGSVSREKINKPKLSPLADAQARATKLRTFKADLQKTKKKKEEEDQRRLEALKKEREQRIAARSSRSPVTPSQLTSRLPTRRTHPSLSFPSKSMIGVPGRADQRKRAAEAVTRLTRSLSLPSDVAKRKEEALGAASQPKRTFQVSRRMSEPRETFGQRLSSSLQSNSIHFQTPPKYSVAGNGKVRRPSSPLRSAVNNGQTPPQNSSAAKSAVNFSQTSQQKSSAAKGSSGQRPSSVRSTLSSGRSPMQISSASNGSSARRLPSPSRKTHPTPTVSARSKSTGKSVLTSEIKNKKTTVKLKTVKDDAGVDAAEIGNRFPQIESTRSSSDEIQPIAQEETKIVAPAKESHGKSVRFSLTDKPFLGDQHHRRAASMDEPCSSSLNPKFGDILYVGSATNRAKERESFKGLKKLFKFGRKTSGDSGLETSSLRSEDLTSTISSSSPAVQKASRRFSILSSFRSKKSSAS